MNVLFLTIAYPEGNERNIYSDLMQEFKDRHNQIYVLCTRERRFGKPTELKNENGVNVLRLRVGNLTKTNVFEKGISTLRLESQFIQAIKKYFGQIKFDLIIYSTPPITFERVVKYVKHRDKCKSYLLLKDIFPQNAVDLGMIKRGSLIWQYFRSKERRLYEISDHIGCMSPANVKYVLKHNPELDSSKVEECPNSIKPLSIQATAAEKTKIRQRYGIPTDAVVFIYGGNLGRPQGIGFLLDVLDRMKNRPEIYFFIIGSGTEFSRIHDHIQQEMHQNVKLLESLPKSDYDKVLKTCDAGLIFLDPRFTIPNFPSRITAYMECSLPIAAATDVNTDVKDMLEAGQCGFWAENGDLDGFLKVLDRLASNSELRQQMGMSGRRYLEDYYTVSRAYEIITKHMKNAEDNINHSIKMESVIHV